MTESEGQGPGDAQPREEPDGRPQIDFDSAFAAIVADFDDPSSLHGGPWPASEDLDDPSSLHGGPWPAGEDLDDEIDDRTDKTDKTVDDSTDDEGSGDDPDAVTNPPAGQRGAPTGHPDPARRRIVLPGDDAASPDRPGPLEDDGTAGRRVPSQESTPAQHAATRRSAHGQDDADDDRYIPPDPPPLPRGDLVSRTAWGAVLGGPMFLLLAALTWRTLPSVLLLLALLAFIGGFITLVARMPQEHPDDPDDGAVV